MQEYRVLEPVLESVEWDGIIFRTQQGESQSSCSDVNSPGLVFFSTVKHSVKNTDQREMCLF